MPNNTNTRAQKPHVVAESVERRLLTQEVGNWKPSRLKILAILGQGRDWLTHYKEIPVGDNSVHGASGLLFQYAATI